MRKLARALALIAMLGSMPPVHGVSSNPGVKPNEWRLLPQPCLYVEGAPGRGSEVGRKLHASDPTWTHMHHYCWAIVQTFRTYRHTMTRKMANEYMDAAIANLDYTIARSQPGFALRPDMFVRKANLLARMGNFIVAADTARALIAESPELPEGYIALADVQLKAGRPDLANETLARGEAAVKDKERFTLLKTQLGSR